MSYNPVTDFLALLRQTSGGVRIVRAPTLGIVLSAMARAGLFNFAVQATAPTVNQSTTAWLQPAAQSWALEGTLFLWNASTAQYEVATPTLWTALLIAAAIPQVQAALGQQRIVITRTVNFNAGNADTIFPIVLPTGFTRFEVENVKVTGASGTLTTATAGLFTAAAGGGVAVVTGASALTVASALDATNNNAQSMAVNNANTETYLRANIPNLYYRVANPQGAAATATVSITIAPVP